MKIEHVAFWVKDLEKMKDFYVQYFGGKSNQKYHNPTKQFTSYFLTFESGARLELMNKPEITDHKSDYNNQTLGIIHLAFSVGGKQQVDELTETLRADGYHVVGEPRTTGDGYYESVVLDPENNLIEIVA